MSDGNTIDLRGHEQVATRKQAEAYAAYAGYEMYYYGYSQEPHDVDPAAANDFDEENPWYSVYNTFCDVCGVWFPKDDSCTFH